MTLLGNPLDYFVVFFGGVLLSFTPCVYPLIPITAGFIGARAAGSKLKGFSLSLVYVSGVAITYSILGLLASLMGKFFGTVSSNPITYIFVGIIIILFGISLLDIFTMPIPNFFKLPTLKKPGYFSTFLLGLSSGLIVSPCITPVLGAILVYLTTKRNLLYGATLLLSFAYGMGFILVLVGTFSAVLVNIPKSGKTMLYIKRLLSFILIGMGIYFILRGLFYSASVQAKEPMVKEESVASDFKLQDLEQNTFILSSYKDEQPVLLFFWTTWCPFCRKELRDLNQIQPELKKDGLEVLAIDVGESPDKVKSFIKSYALSFKVLLDKDTTVARSYSILGVPTYVLIDKKGFVVFQDHYFPRQEYKGLIAE